MTPTVDTTDQSVCVTSDEIFSWMAIILCHGYLCILCHVYLCMQEGIYSHTISFFLVLVLRFHPYDAQKLKEQ